MPSDKRRIMLTLIDDRPFLVLGLDPEEHGAAHVWAALTRYAALVERAGRELEARLDRRDWCYLADVLNGCLDLWDDSGTALSALTLIAAEAEDGQRLNGTGDKWYGAGQGEPGVRALLAKLRRLDPVHGEAILAAVRHFWRDPDLGVDSPWWSVAFRAPTGAR